MRLAGAFARRGWGCAIGPWLSPESTPDRSFAEMRSALEAIAARRLDGYLSIKLSSLGYDDGLFDALLGLAGPMGIRIHLDAVGPETADRTMAAIERAAASHRNVGSTLPAGWKRSPRDAARLAEWGVTARIVKGQWDDPDGRIPDLRGAFAGIARALAGKGVRVGVATHDRRVAREAIVLLKGAGTPCDVEQISGLPPTCAPLAWSEGVPVRVYIPYGHPYLPYSIWQVRTRPAVAAWALRDFIAGRHRRVR